MCFAPQRRALFPHCTFWLRNVLRATTACTFSTSQLPKVVRPWCVLTSKCASHHQGVHFFDISTSNLVRQWCVSCILTSKFEMCFAPQRRALFRHLNFKKWSDHAVFCTFWLRNVLRATGVHFFDISTSKSGPTMVCFDFEMCFAPQRRALFRHLNISQLPIWSDNGVFRAFWLRNSKCASRHNGMHFFDISTSKSGPTMVCFVHFDFEMCFAPQRRALFRHLNFQKWSDHGVFWLRNVLRTTTACTFSSLIWPAGSAPAALASLLFDHPEPQIIGKNIVFRDFPTFSRICASAFFWIFLFSDLLSSNLSLLPASSLLCFSSVHIVGSLTSKLPLTIHIWHIHIHIHIRCLYLHIYLYFYLYFYSTHICYTYIQNVCMDHSHLFLPRNPRWKHQDTKLSQARPFARSRTRGADFQWTRLKMWHEKTISQIEIDWPHIYIVYSHLKMVIWKLYLIFTHAHVCFSRRMINTTEVQGWLASFGQWTEESVHQSWRCEAKGWRWLGAFRSHRNY